MSALPKSPKTLICAVPISQSGWIDTQSNTPNIPFSRALPPSTCYLPCISPKPVSMPNISPTLAKYTPVTGNMIISDTYKQVNLLISVLSLTKLPTCLEYGALWSFQQRLWSPLARLLEPSIVVFRTLSQDVKAFWGISCVGISHSDTCLVWV